ncbi:YcaO-like family protein [Dethiosulfovibrio sp. F2B]|uniref:YcaO-like family protein n=1 Tax=Dethiosulfovibrio faecalis TaxID=2720018 RepID=UPI001F21B90E|nr:YcaO-like family protein [Dethiosulfovibrio faecalis]MCF4151065.1 YcaO-like family protein [Dethiosulfovibrio faecalis]
MSENFRIASPVNFRGAELSLEKRTDKEGTSAHPVGYDEAWRLFDPFLRETGVTRVSDITGLDRIGIPVFNVIRPSMDGYTAAHGKGFTAAAARLSAAGESLERWYGTRDIPGAFRSTWRELSSSYSMVPLERLALTPHSFFHENLETWWVLCWDIVGQEEIPVPLELVRLSPGGRDDRLMDLSEGMLFQSSSNGLACGVHILEAISQALLEVVERDSVTCATLASRAMGCAAPVFRVADQKTIPFSRVTELLERIRAAGIEPILADNGTDVRIPTWNCYLFDLEDPRSLGSVAHGMGSSLDHETAMIRAVTEAVQGRCAFLSGVRDLVPSKEFFRSMNGNGKLSLELMGRNVRETMDLSDVVEQVRSYFEEDVNLCVDRLSAVGLDRVLVFRFSEDGDPVEAVKVIVPGAEGYIFPYYRPWERGISSIRLKTGRGGPLFREEGFRW